jgi:multidrug efflux system membrane fusion protein
MRQQHVDAPTGGQRGSAIASRSARRSDALTPMRRCGAALLVSILASPALAQSGPPPTPPVVVAHPLAQSVPRWDEYTGRFEAVQQVELRPRVSGAVDKINFTDGQMVKAGDLLFVIDPRPYQIAVDSARADVARIQANSSVLSRDLARGQKLVGNGTITLRDADQRKGGADSARAQLLGAEAALRNAELNLEWTQVRAPVAGRVSDRRIDVGNLVQAGTSVLTTIVTLDPIHFIFDASETDYLRQTRAMERRKASDRNARTPVMVRLSDESEWSHAGVLDFTDNALNPRSGTIRSRAVLENKDLFLLPGVFGRAQVLGGEAPELLIPDAAVVSDQTTKIVLTVTGEKKVAPKPVKLGPLYKGLRVVLQGLDAGDLIVISGLANPMVRPGASVEPKEGAIPAPAN